MTVNAPDSPTERTGHAAGDSITLFRFFVIIAWIASVGVCGWFEFFRLRAAIQSPVGMLGWFASWNPDSALPFLVLIALPVITGIQGWRISWKALKKRFHLQQVQPPDVAVPRSFARSFATAVGLFLLSFSCSASIGLRSITLAPSPSSTGLPRVVSFASLPPAYHDEFSYLLQAQTFLAGQVAWPPMLVRPDLFHQIHVLNEPTTASRYFPWTGMWMAAFVKIDQPYVGHWIAGALSCSFFYLSLRMLFSSRWSLIGGLLIAISPGLAVFSNLLLAHHPTMLALSVFLWSFLKLMESNSRAAAIVSGIALAAAMLGRPMTAAGFALPFGVWLLVQWLRTLLRPSQEVDEPGVCLRSLLLVGTPLVAGFVILAIMNHKITGQWNRSAYQLYTDTWTPRHRFGFHNVEIGSQLAGPKVLESYDRWATDLTATKAAENVSNRIIASTQWTLGVGSLLFLLLAAIPSMMPRQRCDIRMTLIGCSVLSLHLVHIPYWYDGILHWHYVFETAPLLLILATSGLRNTAVVLQPLRTQWILRGWLAALGLASLIPNWVDAESLWGPSRVSLAVGEQSYSRVRFEMFRRMIHSPAVIQPSLILVDERQSDVQLSYIVNPPDLSGDSLVCRMPTSSAEISELAAAFPDRTFYRFDPQSFELQQLDRQNP